MQSAIYFDEKLSQMPQDHLEGLVALVRRVWEPEATIKSYLAKRASVFEGNPYARKAGLPVSILIDEGKVIGHDAAVPCMLWANGIEVMAYYQAGLHLDIEYRGKRLGAILPKLMYKSMDNKFAFFVIPQQYKTHAKLGWVMVGKMPEYMRVINEVSFFEKLDITNINQMPLLWKKAISSSKKINNIFSKTIPSSLLKVWNSACDGLHRIIFQHQDFHCEWPESFDARLDLLWQRVKSHIAFTQVRHSGYLNWHFPRNRGWKYLTIYRNEVLEGYAILYTKEFHAGHKLSKMKVTTIVDLLWDFSQPDVLGAIIDASIRHATENDADVLLTAISRREARNTLFRYAFFPIPTTVHFTCHSSDPKVRFSNLMSEWYLTRGIADGAGSLGAP